MSTWKTYIGGKYETKSRFIREASKPMGFSRRIPARNAKSMRFGDRVVFLRWERKRAVAFAEGRIDQVIFDKETTEKLGEILFESGAVEYHPGPLGGSNVHRECGSYCIMGTLVINDPEKLNIPELVKMAMDLAGEGEKVFCMIGGKLLRVYDEPMILEPSPKFTRGFIKGEDAESFEYEPEPGQVLAIQNYRRK